MGKILVVVESPGKISKLQKFLGDDYVVKASVGHIMDLAPGAMNIDIENNFTPQYSQIRNKNKRMDKTKVIADLRKEYDRCDSVILATDQDREGEMIGWSVQQVLKAPNPDRMTFTEITEEEVKKGLQNLRKLDYHLIDAQKARRILDRLLGYELSPLLWKQMNMTGALSAGRVQSVVLRLIVDREREIKAFYESGISSYFRFIAQFRKNQGPPMRAILHDQKKSTKKSKDSESLSGSVTKLSTLKEAREEMRMLAESEFVTKKVFDKMSKRQPGAPFTTNTLQQEASSRLGYNPKRTMSAAQHLYEAGYITYMRTDSINLSNNVRGQAKKYILDTFGADYLQPRSYQKGKNTQEAHEAIRPTTIKTKEIFLNGKKKLGHDERRLYQLIWRRTVATQMSSAEIKITTAQIVPSKDPDRFFSTQMETIVFEGYLRVYGLQAEGESEETKPEEEAVSKSNKITATHFPKVGEALVPDEIKSREEYPPAPPRYNYPALLRVLDPKNMNIGRPATYSSIIETITEKRGYALIQDVEGQDCQISQLLATDFQQIPAHLQEEEETIKLGQDKNKFVPQTIGMMVTDYLVENFPTIMDYKFTAQMENLLDEIAIGKKQWVGVIRDFYQQYHPKVIELLKNPVSIQDKFTRSLGFDPESNKHYWATIKRHGPVVMRSDTEDGKKPEYAPIKPPLKLEKITLTQALKIFVYPKIIGEMKLTSRSKPKPIKFYRGKYGPYLKIGDLKLSLPDAEIPDEQVDMKLVEKLMEDRKKNQLGNFSDETRTYTVLKGPYGPYIKIQEKKSKSKKGLNVKIPDEKMIPDLTLEKVLEIIENHYNRRRGGRKKVTKKKTIKKAGSKKKVAKKKASPKKKVVKKKVGPKKTPTKSPKKKASPKKKIVKKKVGPKKTPKTKKVKPVTPKIRVKK